MAYTYTQAVLEHTEIGSCPPEVGADYTFRVTCAVRSRFFSASPRQSL